MLTIATWNVNSVKARLPNVLAWLRQARPDVVLFQELKCETAAFPALEFEDLGYNLAVHGQKSWNGVALLSRRPIEDVVRGLPPTEGDDAPADEQARYIEATVGTVRIASLYLPNGNPPDTEKYPYKLRWMDRLRRHAAALLETGQAFVLGGDFNVIPAEADVYDPAGWAGDALFKPETRARFRALLHLGLTEAWRALHPAAVGAYTFWDYQGRAWPADHGLRIDHFLLSPEAADRLEACEIDKAPRAEPKASDHVPVVLTLRED